MNLLKRISQRIQREHKHAVADWRSWMEIRPGKVEDRCQSMWAGRRFLPVTVNR